MTTPGGERLPIQGDASGLDDGVVSMHAWARERGIRVGEPLDDFGLEKALSTRSERQERITQVAAGVIVVGLAATAAAVAYQRLHKR